LNVRVSGDCLSPAPSPPLSFSLPRVLSECLCLHWPHSASRTPSTAPPILSPFFPTPCLVFPSVTLPPGPLHPASNWNEGESNGRRQLALERWKGSNPEVMELDQTNKPSFGACCLPGSELDGGWARSQPLRSFCLRAQKRVWGVD
jgi:hypothetical protein